MSAAIGAGRARRVLDSAVIVAIAATYILTVVATIRHREWNSDDTGMQVLLRTFRPFGSDAHVSDDTFVLKYPLYALVDAVAGSSIRSLLVTVWAIQLAELAALIAVFRLAGADRSRDDLRRASALVPLLWLASLGPTFLSPQVGPNLRNLELALAVLLAVAATRARRRNQLVALGVAAGVLFLDDPFSAYTVAIPTVCAAAAVTVIRRFRSSDRAAFDPIVRGGIVAAIGLFVWQATKRIVELAGLHIHERPFELASRREVWTGLRASWDGLRYLTGSSAPAAGARQLAGLVALAALAIAAAFAIARRRGSVAWYALPASTVAAFVLSRQALDPSASRYLLFAVVALALAATANWDAMPARIGMALGALLLVSSAANAHASFRLLRPPPVAQPHVALAELLRSEGETKGYAGFWDANITTYLSDGQVSILAVACDAGRSVPYYWNTDDRPRSAGARRSVFVFDDAGTAGACTPVEVRAEFGEPVRLQKFLAWTVFFYDTDVGTQMPRAGASGYGTRWSP